MPFAQNQDRKIQPASSKSKLRFEGAEIWPAWAPVLAFFSAAAERLFGKLPLNAIEPLPASPADEEGSSRNRASWTVHGSSVAPSTSFEQKIQAPAFNRRVLTPANGLVRELSRMNRFDRREPSDSGPSLSRGSQTRSHRQRASQFQIHAGRRPPLSLPMPWR